MNRRLIGVGAVLLLAITTAASAAEPTLSWTLSPAPAPVSKLQVEQGKREFQNACTICHGGGAPDRPGTLSLQSKYQGTKPALLEERTDLTPEVVKFFIRNGIAMMPQFRKTELSDAQVAAIAAYLARKR